MSAYARELVRARKQARPLRGIPPQRSGRVKSKDGLSVNRRSLAVIPSCESFTCGDARSLVVYHYFKRPAGRLKPKQVDFLHAVEGHLLLSAAGESQPKCMCKRILKLIDWYFDCWFDKKVLTPWERVESLDSARLTEEGIDLIASVVEGRL